MFDVMLLRTYIKELEDKLIEMRKILRELDSESKNRVYHVEAWTNDYLMIADDEPKEERNESTH